MSTHNICFLREIINFRTSKSWLNKWILSTLLVRGQMIKFDHSTTLYYYMKIFDSHIVKELQ